MPRWVAKDVVPDASFDLWGRRTRTRIFTIWNLPIDEGTATRVAAMLPTDNSNWIIDDETNQPLPTIGSPWSADANASKFAQMYLESYNVQVQAQEIIATATYSSDFDAKNIEIGWSPQNVQIPYAIKVATGVAFAGGGGGSTYTWQHTSWNVPLNMKRLQITGKVHVSSLGDLDDALTANVNRLFWLRILKVSTPGATNPGAETLWKFEGAQVNELGPDYVNVRYSLLADPGNTVIDWPVEMTAGGTASNFAIPPIAQKNGWDDAVRFAFHELKVLPPVYLDGERIDGRSPRPPTFLNIPNSRGIANGRGVSASMSLIGVGLFPFTTRAYR